MTLINELLLKGGWINQILLVAYMVINIIIIERMLYFFMKRGRYTQFLNQLTQLLAKGKKTTEISSDELPFKRSIYFDLFNRYKALKDETAEKREKLIIVENSNTIANFERGLTLLSVVGALAPMLGLLGTMLGLVKAFKGIELSGGAVDITVLSGGIWEAMLTTIAGLIVGIIAIFAWRFFDSRITLISNRLDDLSLFLDAHNQ